MRDNTKSFCDKRITRQYGRRLAKNFMIGGFAAAEIIIVHARKIIMNQRISVNEFNRCSESYYVFGFFIQSFSHKNAEDRTNALTAFFKRIADRLTQYF